MKKLLFILSAIFVSVMGWAQTTMNPYAYDLQSTWNPSTKKLNLSFKLNAQANLNEGGSYGHSAGIMVKLVASDGREYKVIPVSTADIKNGLSHNYEIDFANYKNKYGNLLPEGIPAGTDLTWKVDVAGESSDKGRKSPLVTCWNAAYRPVSTHGVAVSKGYNSADFGRIYATVYNDNSEDIIQGRYTWLKNKTPSVINYEPMYLATDGQIPTTYTASGFKSSYDPHRVRVSDDGRMFVSSQWSGDRSVVWECTNGVYKGIITRTSSNGTIVAMDVKGSGDNLKLLLCEMIVNYSTYSDQGNSKQPHARLIIHEYNIGKSTTARSISDSDKEIYYNDYRTDANKAGMIYQGFTGNWQSVKTEGMISIAYGKNNSIWLKMDFGSGSIKPRVVYFAGTNNCANYYDTGSSTYSGMKGTSLPNAYGGSAILIFDDNLITAYPDYLSFYKYDAYGTLTKQYNDLYTTSGTFRGIADWCNDLAIDPANNVYAVSSDAMNLMVISLPYSGLTTTKAPDAQKFQIPYPATNLEYHPVEGKNQYTFSFNAVNKPAHVAEIRFYDTKEKMLAGGNDYAFRYQIPAEQYKQGTMSVTFDATIPFGHDKKTFQDNDGNGNFNLLPGKYYWNVYIDYFSTPTPESECYLPERITQDHDNGHIIEQYLQGGVYDGQTCSTVDIFRPLRNDCYNTFCLPFDLDLTQLADGHPYKVLDNNEGATLLEFSGVELKSFNNGENCLELQFTKVNEVLSGVPYLFKPKEEINSIVSLKHSDPENEIQFKKTEGFTVIHDFSNQENNVTYYGIISVRNVYTTEPDEIILILVDQNRLAKITEGGNILGFRGVFVLAHSLPAGTVARIAERKPTPTSVINLNGEQVDVEKFLREGRVYIRVGEDLYNIDGQKVE